MFRPEKYKIGTSEENQSTSTFCVLSGGKKKIPTARHHEWAESERERRQRRRRVSVGGINDLNCCEYWISFQISAPTPLNINSIFVSFCLMASIVLLYLYSYGAPLLKKSFC